MNWNHILNWKLLCGSHEFPGPDGGTCINEAAVVAAGFEYRAIVKPNDCPPCFSRPIAAYAIKINDVMPYHLRQKLLLPFVMRLAGTADNDRIEQERVRLIVMLTINKIVPIALMIAGLRADARACSEALCLDTAASAARAASTGGPGAAAAYVVKAAVAPAAAAAAAAAAYVVESAVVPAASAAASVAAHAAAAATHADLGGDVARIWHIAAEILDGALRIGNRADLLDIATIKDRLDGARAERIIQGGVLNIA